MYNLCRGASAARRFRYLRVESRRERIIAHWAYAWPATNLKETEGAFLDCKVEITRFGLSRAIAQQMTKYYSFVANVGIFCLN